MSWLTKRAQTARLLEKNKKTRAKGIFRRRFLSGLFKGDKERETLAQLGGHQ